MPVSFSTPPSPTTSRAPAPTGLGALPTPTLDSSTPLPITTPNRTLYHDPFSRLAPTGGPFIFDPAASAWLPILPDHPAPIGYSPQPLSPGDSLQIITWNVDYSTPHPRERIESAISHIRNYLETVSPPPTATAILLQELHDPDPDMEDRRNNKDDNSAMAALLADPWVEDGFVVAATYFRGRYGVTTLVSKSTSLALTPPHSEPGVRGCFRAPLPGSVMERDVLGVDIKLAQGGVVRVCNVHLESLVGHGTKIRPVQLAFVAGLLREPGVVAGVVAGDMNAIAPTDWGLVGHSDVRLTDLWEAYNPDAPRPEKLPLPRDKGVYESDETRGEKAGHTWGYQSIEGTKYHPGRLDKILFTPGEGGLVPVERAGVPRLGVGVMVEVELDAEDCEELGITSGGVERVGGKGKLWCSDHFGLVGRFLVGGGEEEGKGKSVER